MYGDIYIHPQRDIIINSEYWGLLIIDDLFI